MAAPLYPRTQFCNGLTWRALPWITLLWMFLDLGNTTLAAQTQKNLLAIYGGRSDQPGNIVVDRTIRSILDEQFGITLDYKGEYMTGEPPSDEREKAFGDYLRNKYKGVRFDVIVAVSNEAVRFVRNRGNELFPGVPVVLWGGREEFEHWGSDRLSPGF